MFSLGRMSTAALTVAMTGQTYDDGGIGLLKPSQVPKVGSLSILVAVGYQSAPFLSERTRRDSYKMSNENSKLSE